MPHIVAYHSWGDQFAQSDLLKTLHDALCNAPTVDPKTVKSYALPVEQSWVGTVVEPDHMLHIIVRMKPGRDMALKSSISKTIHDLARSFAQDNAIATTISVEVLELENDSYCSSHM